MIIKGRTNFFNNHENFSVLKKKNSNIFDYIFLIVIVSMLDSLHYIVK